MRTPAPLGLVLTGGGARAAYQVGVLRGLAGIVPDLRIPILAGVSAGAINVTHMASRPGPFAADVEALQEAWCGVGVGSVFRADGPSLFGRGARAIGRLASGGLSGLGPPRGLVDTSPLREFLRHMLGADESRLTGIRRNLAAGRLDAVAVTASSYTTGRSVTWVESSTGHEYQPWDLPQRTSKRARLSVEHVMASAALPVMFPAVRVGQAWYGDGGIRLTAPLSPAIRLGAERIIAVSTRYQRSRSEALAPSVLGYPPLAQILGLLLNAVFLDLIDGDAQNVERVNALLDILPPERRPGLRRIELLVLRPSRDLGRLANDYEARLPRALRFLTRGLGTRETRSNDLLSLLMFQNDYVQALLELGQRDVEARRAEVEVFLARD
jgi:NTE family protein